jgi:hypothetical protein
VTSREVLAQLRAFLTLLEKAVPSPKGWRGHRIAINGEDNPMLVIELGQALGVTHAAIPFALDMKTFDQLVEGTNHESLVDEVYKLAINTKAQGAQAQNTNTDRTKN